IAAPRKSAMKVGQNRVEQAATRRNLLMARFEIRLGGGTMNRDRSVFVPAPIPFKQRSSHAAYRISPTARFSGCAWCALGRASACLCAAGTAGTGGALGNSVPPRQGGQSTSRRDGNDRAGHAQGGYAADRPGPGLLYGQDPEAVHQQRLFSGENRGTRHLRGRRGGDGPVQSGQRRTSRRDQPGRHLPDWLAKGERVVGLCSAEPRRLLDLTVCPARTLAG